ncbi:tRNA uridine 5-carboxymethylaminomethyl modification enzyme MnmG [Synergistales bacterium]|nr:tRNA uridine 5-carboxymethylaminomethyl modification enzyme MnmG [Synergistales bacterium]
MFSADYDVIVIGGGHAGCEAALAASRMGRRVLMLNHNVDNTALMPCNPSIGGPAKGHLVREISALGGEQARAADASTLMVRWLNTGKGEAVRALRAQCDPRVYAAHYIWKLETQEGLDVHQDEAVALLLSEGRVSGVSTRHGSVYTSRAVVLCSGVYGGGVAHVGDVAFPSGPMGQTPANAFFESLSSLGVRLNRMRTDTTPRLNLDTIDLSKTRAQKSEETPLAFDIWGEKRVHTSSYACYFSHTTPETHAIVARNIHRSPLFRGEIKTLGPRYCPSIEDKFMKFPDRDVHPIIFEPISRSTKEVYVQNFSTGLPYDVQVELVRSLEGCRNTKIIKPAYAIEYMVVTPDQLSPTLENKDIKGFFCAGQVNGTSGYEEAAAQGLLAGINAALSARDEPPVVLSRRCAYLGVLVDDLTTKDTNEPYRMLTSRCEHRLLLRHDNADRRLTPIARRLGLISDAKWEEATTRWARVDAFIDMCEHVRVSPDKANAALSLGGAEPLSESATYAQLLRRKNVNYKLLNGIRPEREAGGEKWLDDEEEALCAETAIRYAGYIERQEKTARRMDRFDGALIPETFDYASVRGLLAESRQKLVKFRPRSLGAALRISGVTPTDVELLSVAIKARGK